MKEKDKPVLYDFLVTVKAAPHEWVIRTGQSQTYTRPKKKRRKFILKILRIKWELQNLICYLCFATIPATHYSHCFIELSQPKLVYWLSFYFQVFHVHIHFI